jgi:hypothetical protein
VSSALLDAPRVAPAPPRPAVATGSGARAAGRPRVPLPVAGAAALALLEALALLACGLTGLDGLFGTGVRPSGVLVALTLLLLAGWVVLCAGGGVCLVDGAGRRLVRVVACGEIALLLVLTLAGVLGADGVRLVVLGPLGALPLPALALLALGVPTAKLLLAGAPSTLAWVQAGGRPRTARCEPAVQHRGLRTVTLTCIGLALTGVALLGGSTGTPAAPSTAAVTDGP